MWKISSGNLYRILFKMDFARRFFYAVPPCVEKITTFFALCGLGTAKAEGAAMKNGAAGAGRPWRYTEILLEEPGDFLWWIAVGCGRARRAVFGRFWGIRSLVCHRWGIPAKTLEMRWVNTRLPGNNSLPGRLQEPMEERAVCCCRRPGGRFYLLFGSQGGVFNINVMRQA